MQNLIEEKEIKEKELKDSLELEIKEEISKKDKRLELNDDNKIKELFSNRKQYISDIEEIKREYTEKIKLRKQKFNQSVNMIINKYKLSKEYIYIKNIYNIEKLNNQFNEEIRYLNYDNKIENMKSIIKINSLIFKLYSSYNDNYFNACNINNLLLNYCKNQDIKKIMKNLLGEKYDEILEIIMEKKKGEEQKDKEFKEHYVGNYINNKK